MDPFTVHGMCFHNTLSVTTLFFFFKYWDLQSLEIKLKKEIPVIKKIFMESNLIFWHIELGIWQESLK